MAPESGRLCTRGSLWYGWIVTGAAAVLAGAAMTGQFFPNVLLDAWVAEFGWGRGTAALSYSVFWLILGFLSAPVGWAAERWGMRRLALAGALLFAAGTFLMGTMERVWELYLYQGLLVGLSAAIFWGPLYPYLGRWSRERMGLLVAIVSIGMVTGGAVFPPILRVLETTLGWRNAVYVMALAEGLAMVAAASFLKSPAAPAGSGASRDAASGFRDGLPRVGAGEAFRQHWRGRVFWGLSAGHFLGCMTHAGIMVHLISIVTSRGISGVAAASALSVMMAASVVGRFVFPVGTERVGPRGSLATLQLGQTVGVLGLLLASDLAALYASVFFLGLFFGGEFPIFPVLTRLYYPDHLPIEALFGGVMAWAGIGMALGGWLMGALYDVTGSYSWGLIVSAGSGLAGTLAVLALPVRLAQGELSPGSRA